MTLAPKYRRRRIAVAVLLLAAGVAACIAWRLRERDPGPLQLEIEGQYEESRDRQDDAEQVRIAELMASREAVFLARRDLDDAPPPADPKLQALAEKYLASDEGKATIGDVTITLEPPTSLDDVLAPPFAPTASDAWQTYAAANFKTVEEFEAGRGVHDAANDAQVAALDGETACVCGHSKEDHGGHIDYPGSTACNECEPGACIVYEVDL